MKKENIVNKDGLDVTLEGNELTILGHRSNVTEPGEALFRESRPVDYRRTFELDPAIDTSRMSAQMEQGVLTLVLPKVEKVKPRRPNFLPPLLLSAVQSKNKFPHPVWNSA